jgi:radical SAM protein with 4Fe4S-binding SPASM domain
MFSIVMPVWNRENVVPKAIESVLSQTFENYELIIVDDGSEDGSKKVIEPYLSERIIYFKIPHSGNCAARNYALTRATGDYIAYLDSDNIWHPEYLLSMWKALNSEDSQRKAAYCMYNLYKKDKATGNIRFEGVKGEEFNFKKLLTENYIDISTFVHSRDCVRQVGLWDESLRRLTDWDYVTRVTAKFEPIFVPQVLVDYFFGVEKNTVTLNESYEIAFNAIRKKTMAYERPVTLWHDAIKYEWMDVPHRKYYNWMRMTSEELDSTTFAANGFPYMLQIEPTNFCNLACPFCPAGRNELGRERRHMKIGEFKTIIHDLEDYLLFLVMWDWGEPFMNPDLPAMIRCASEKGIKTVTSTNGQFFSDESYLEDLLTSGLTTLIVAMDSLYEDNYEACRKGGSLNRALEGLKKVVALKKKLDSKTHINMRMVIMKQNERELDSLRARAKSFGVDRFSVKTVNPSCDPPFNDEDLVPENPSYRRYEYEKGSYHRVRLRDSTICGVWSMCNVRSNGDIVPCCYDYDGKMKVGNIHKQRVSEAWNGPEFRELRKKITCERNSLARCKYCSVNFKLSATGWFVESIDFSKEPLEGEELVQSLKAQLLKSEADRSAMSDVIHKLRAQLQESEADRAARFEVIESQAKRLEALKGSLSWRLTAPPRWVLDRLRKKK